MSAGASSVRGAAEIPYRADIDGLRAIAVLYVIGFHTNPKLVPGGFTGVETSFSSTTPTSALPARGTW
jgi:peptidoglycan/LPS O-acetylase OafA/YrhL